MIENIHHLTATPAQVQKLIFTLTSSILYSQPGEDWGSLATLTERLETGPAAARISCLEVIIIWVMIIISIMKVFIWVSDDHQDDYHQQQGSPVWRWLSSEWWSCHNPRQLNVPCLYLLMMLITNPDRRGLEDPNDNQPWRRWGFEEHCQLSPFCPRCPLNSCKE